MSNDRYDNTHSHTNTHTRAHATQSVSMYQQTTKCQQIVRNDNDDEWHDKTRTQTRRRRRRTKIVEIYVLKEFHLLWLMLSIHRVKWTAARTLIINWRHIIGTEKKNVYMNSGCLVAHQMRFVQPTRRDSTEVDHRLFINAQTIECTLYTQRAMAEHAEYTPTTSTHNNKCIVYTAYAFIARSLALSVYLLLQVPITWAMIIYPFSISCHARKRKIKVDTKWQWIWEKSHIFSILAKLVFILLNFVWRYAEI